MKLQARYNRIAVASSVLVLLLSGIGYLLLLYLLLPHQLEPEWNRQAADGPEGVPGPFLLRKTIGVIALATIGLIIFLSVVLFLVNRLLCKTLWQPFHATLAAMKNFVPAAPAPISLTQTAIDEFNELNDSVRQMTEKVIRDYQSLKEFTDNASHEMQTPLAVVNARLDLLIQDPHLRAEQLQQVQGIYNAVEKLSRLSRSLLLLSKICNNQFSAVQKVSINALVQHKLEEFEEWIHSKELTVLVRMEPLVVCMDGQLAEILLNNLLSNAIRHAHKGSTVMVRSRNSLLRISNPGRQALDRRRIFDRFYKSERSEGAGLGLAIARQICEQYGYQLSYDFIDYQHHFTIRFQD